MKKQSIILGSLLMITAAMHATPMSDVMGQISTSGVMCTPDTLFNLSMAEQNNNLGELAKATTMAKEFAINNSKNLIGSKDSDIAKAVAAIDTASMDFINSVKVTRGLSGVNDLTNQANQLAAIKKNLITATNKFGSTMMALSNKKDAKKVLMALAGVLEDLIDYTHKDILRKINTIGGVVGVN